MFEMKIVFFSAIPQNMPFGYSDTWHHSTKWLWMPIDALFIIYVINLVWNNRKLFLVLTFMYVHIMCEN